jgi:hypothetical protein
MTLVRGSGHCLGWWSDDPTQANGWLEWGTLPSLKLQILPLRDAQGQDDILWGALICAIEEPGPKGL